MLRKCRLANSVLDLPLRRVVLAACAVAVVAGVSVSEANAMSVISTWKYPGVVREAALPVTCEKWVPFGRYLDKVTANGPAVYARALSNGSTGQWVYEEIKFFDLTTQSVSTYDAPGWTWATTTTPAILPSDQLNFAWDDRVAVVIRLWWWDPISRTYTGQMDYAVDSYYRLPTNGYPDSSC